MDLSQKTCDTLLKAFFLCLLVMVCYVDLTKGYLVNNNWTYGDWLINYQAGFYRRGLLGQLALYSGYAKITILLLHMACYSIIFLNTYLILRALNFPKAFLLFLLSPGLFLFDIYDPQGGFRKEIMAFALLSWNALASIRADRNHAKNVYYISLTIFPILILAHELLSIFLPLLIAIQHRAAFESRTSFIITLLMSLLSFALFIFLMSMPPLNLSDTPLICAPLLDFCREDLTRNGAITWLTYDASHSIQRVQHDKANMETLLRYTASIALLAIPIVKAKSAFNIMLQKKVTLLFLSAFLLGILLLHTIAIDWGRFLHMLFMGMFFMLLTFQHKNAFTSIRVTPLLSLYLLVYCFAWKLDHLITFRESSLIVSMAGPYIVFLLAYYLYFSKRKALP